MQTRFSRALSSGIAAAAAALALLAGAPAHAALVSFDYTAQGASGATAQGTFGWNTDAPTAPATVGGNNELIAIYYLGSGFMTGQVSGGVLDGESVAKYGLDWVIADRDPAGEASDSLTVVFSSMFVMLSDYTRLALSSLDMPTALNLSDWTGEHRVRLVGAQGLEDFTILSLSLSQAVPTDRQDLPEPGSLALLAVAAGAALAARRRLAR
jgi:hypothetical protein